MAAVETKALGTYPPKRFKEKRENKVVIFTHIMAGLVVIFGGVAYVIREHSEGQANLDDGSEENRFKAIGFVSLIHSVTIM